ncbi:MAG: hypothetical protein KIT84_41980 [Labilithrix sp.]|nr:hypothetical protein [Labilithrix sp.]MCW5817644.1 hypothetical protein [Labilithrix sp.]
MRARRFDDRRRAQSEELTTNEPPTCVQPKGERDVAQRDDGAGGRREPRARPVAEDDEQRERDDAVQELDDAETTKIEL